MLYRVSVIVTVRRYLVRVHSMNDNSTGKLIQPVFAIHPNYK